MSEKNNPREIFGWKMYDWANSAFYTTVVGALFSPYITRLAQSAVGENGVVLDLGPLGHVTAKSLPTLCVSISVGLQVFLLPVLGALGDYSDLKKRLMALFCYIAVIANCLMFFIQGDLYLFGGLGQLRVLYDGSRRAFQSVHHATCPVSRGRKRCSSRSWSTRARHCEVVTNIVRFNLRWLAGLFASGVGRAR